jgi:1,4-dihydroxy-2-naphthoate octaprenyltransferase
MTLAVRSPPAAAPPRPDVKAGIWRLADPKITLASMASLFLGTCAAARDGPLSPGWLALTVLGIFFLEVAKNASGEIFDFDTGADAGVAPEDRSPFSGGKRVMVDGLLTRGQTKLVAAVAYGLGIATGLAIVVFRAFDVLWLGLAGTALAFFYHAPPVKLSYRGLGELAVGLAYGPLIAAGAYLVQRGVLSRELLLLSLPLGALISAFLWINEFPDCRADLAAGKRTLVVRLGRPRAAVAFALLVAAAGAAALLLPGPARWGALSLLPGLAAARIALRSPEDTPRIVRAQALALIAFLVFSAAAGVAWIASRAP